ncbi:hypothetical protein GCM10009555_058300 [Acrocarpospora macrocephala]|uniref:Tail protein n=1 Tax=Acrocarpospora macrocephala TaxID=150177 RepID=A0A5M3WRJ4_9ACTN|nr:phage tail protein [Acrocarpospora macrocephala]GES11945.1 hypothetical protein Amac_055420 [Acrocarpospora macrocephala]
MSELYDLLPALYRLRDRERGEPLRALLAVIEREVRAVEADIGRLYDDWFIETCQERLVPYLGDLLGVRGLLPPDDGTFSTRGYVANTLGYRRRKGTAAVLEQLARDLTGWPAEAVEYFELLAATQHVNHPRPHARATADLRSAYALEKQQNLAHTAEVRHIDSGRGRYGLANVGLILHRVQAYPLTGVSARQVDATRFTLDPLGGDLALHGLSRLALHHDLESRYGDAADPADVVVIVGGSVVPRGSIVVCALADSAGGWAHQAPPGKVALDPLLGRVAFATPPAAPVTSSFRYGATGDLGGGPYDKRPWLAPHLDGVTWQAGVTAAPPADEPRIKATLADAVKDWNQQPPGTRGVIVLMDSRTLTEDLKNQATRIRVPRGSTLVIVSGGWPVEEGGERRPGRVAPRLVRAHLRGRIEGVGEGALAFVGVLFEGSLVIKAGGIRMLHLAHCTLSPASTVLTCEDNPGLAVRLERTIAGRLDPGTAPLALTECLIHGDLTARDLTVDSSTVLGATTARTLEATSSIFTGKVTVERRQVGCVRFSALPATSTSPRRFRCVDDRAPVFVSAAFGHPGSAVLAVACPAAIAEGGEGETEMGVWRFTQVPRRLRNLRLAFDEYLRFGLEAGIFFAPMGGAR